MDLDYVGYISYDDFVWRSIKERRTLVLSYPQSDGALYLRQIAKKLLSS
jgi:MinD-like ATPase involved in chromosome partitioning or flagellar assembly